MLFSMPICYCLCQSAYYAVLDANLLLSLSICLLCCFMCQSAIVYDNLHTMLINCQSAIFYTNLPTMLFSMPICLPCCFICQSAIFYDNLHTMLFSMSICYFLCHSAYYAVFYANLPTMLFSMPICRGKKLNKFSPPPPNRRDDLCLCFCLDILLYGSVLQYLCTYCILLPESTSVQ